MRSTPRLQGCIAASLVIAAGCSAGPVPLSDYSLDLDQSAARAVEPFAAGRDLVIGGTLAVCEGFGANTFDDLDSTAAFKLGAEPYASIAHIEEAVVVSREKGAWLALRLRDEAGKERWLRLPSDAPLACLRPATDAIRAAGRQRGRSFVFTPWAPSCRHIEAAGTAPNAALLSGDPFVPAAVEAVVFRDRSSADGRGDEPWLLLRRGTLRVRADALANCFASKREPAKAQAPALLHDLGRCAPALGGRADILVCTSTLGIWEGVVSDTSVSLDLVHATLGSARFFADHPAESGPGIALATGPQDPDAIAMSVAGARLVAKEQHGESPLTSGGGVALPSAAFVIPAGECLLAVAAGEAGATLTLASDDGVFSDKRKKSTAFVEACASELPVGNDSINLSLKSDTRTSTQWALYRTHSAPGRAQ